jgi:uncharacterized membrane protein
MTRLWPAALAIGYPLLIYLGVRFGEPRLLAACVGAVLSLRLPPLLRRADPGDRLRLLAPLGTIAALAAAAAIWDDARALLLLPVVISAALLVTFARSLRAERSMIEIFATLQAGELPAEEIPYCRSVTRVWCGFFAANGLVAGWLALAASPEAWALYSGLLAYVAIGLLFAGEVVYRAWRFRRYTGAFSDPLLRRLFPPAETGGPSASGPHSGDAS